MNYPSYLLNQDKIIPELFRFKNKENKLIIIYHSDERNSVPIGQQFFEKGYTNVYILSGGIEKFLEDFTPLVEGDQVPTPQKKAVIEKEMAKKEAKQARINKRHMHCVEEHGTLKTTLGQTSHHTHNHH